MTVQNLFYTKGYRSTSVNDIKDQYDQQQSIELVQRKLRTTQVAIERVLRAPQGSFPLIDEIALNAWFR